MKSPETQIQTGTTVTDKDSRTDEDKAGRGGTGNPVNILIHQKPASFDGNLSHTTEITTFKGSRDYHKPFQKRSLKFINTHFGEMCICILGLRKGEERRGK